MWLSRKNSINSTATSPKHKSNFNRHSFKNIDEILGDDDKNASNDHQKPKQKPSSPISPSSAATAASAAAKRHSVFHRVRLANQFTRSITPGRSKPNHEKSQSPQSNNAATAHKSEVSAPAVRLPGSEKRVVMYMTSLGAVRPTFDACRAVRSILQGFRVAVDERDLSMDSSFKEELQKIMSAGGGKKLGLPRVFIGGSYVGDAEDMRQLNETGELKKLVEGLPAVSRGVCEGCGDFRFVICSDCNGSRKCYRKKGGFRSCTACNKNGLIRCPTCCTVKS
ncbi:hypothetical protein L1987_77943 [Smallanthus sonchifolius]|uniref:Uncharacterized protein n=1 Tax=Smallanthus sonchifolius TaxID=185202 RepID=A0ACB8ZAE7_9ASTR|nr:hypothetical protein L1987_77943 [Smallanthus sonchifolius]